MQVCEDVCVAHLVLLTTGVVYWCWVSCRPLTKHAGPECAVVRVCSQHLHCCLLAILAFIAVCAAPIFFLLLMFHSGRDAPCPGGPPSLHASSSPGLARRCMWLWWQLCQHLLVLHVCVRPRLHAVATSLDVGRESAVVSDKLVLPTLAPECLGALKRLAQPPGSATATETVGENRGQHTHTHHTHTGPTPQHSTCAVRHGCVKILPGGAAVCCLPCMWEHVGTCQQCGCVERKSV